MTGHVPDTNLTPPPDSKQGGVSYFHLYEHGILTNLASYHPNPRTAKQIAIGASLKYNSYLRTVLHQLKADGKLDYLGRAGYVLKGPVSSTEIELRLENLLLVARADIRQVRGTNRVSPAHGRDKYFGGRSFIEWYFRQWRVTIQEFDNGTVEVQLGVRGEKGLTMLDFLAFAGWLEGLYPRIPMGLWHVKDFEFNHDMYHLRLDGASSITLQSFTNLWLKLYQKPKALRLEARYKSDIKLDDAVELMTTIAKAFADKGLVRMQEVR